MREQSLHVDGLPARPGGRFFALGAALSFLVLVTGAATARAEPPAASMKRVANQLIEAQRAARDKPTTPRVLRSHADVPTIAITALGSYAQNLDKSDRPAYYAGMINFISRYASKEGPKYPVAKRRHDRPDGRRPRTASMSTAGSR